MSKSHVHFPTGVPSSEYLTHIIFAVAGEYIIYIKYSDGETPIVNCAWLLLLLSYYFTPRSSGMNFRLISGKHQHWPLSKNILRHSYSANTMALSWNSNNTAMFFVVLLLFLILICFYYIYCTLLSLSIVLLHVCT